jgi:hypothetical protein
MVFLGGERGGIFHPNVPQIERAGLDSDRGGVGRGWDMLDGLPVVECPGCKVKMAVILVEPMTPNDCMDDLSVSAM